MVLMVARTSLVRSNRLSGGGGGGAAPTFVAAGTAANAGDVTTINVPYYAGLAADDIALMFVTFYGNRAAADVSGWTGETMAPSSGDTQHIRFYWKRLVGSESGNVTVTFSGGSEISGVLCTMIGVRGCIATGTPYEGYASNTGASSTATSPSTVTTDSSRLLVRAYSTDGDGLSSPPGGWTERFDSVGTSSGFITLAVDTKELASAGTETASTRSPSTANIFACTGLAMIPA